MIKAIIFDMDGLMIDSESLYFQVEGEIAESYGKKVGKKTLWKMMGRKPIESISILVKELNLPDKPEKVLEMRDKMMMEKFKNDLNVMPGLIEIIDFFYRRLKLAVATGATREFLDIVVDQLDLREKFSVLQASDEIVHGKPDPEIYLKTCEKLGLKPAECIVLEDSDNGVRAGKSAGCYTIAVPSEYTEGQNFTSADFLADNLLDAQNHISSVFNME